MPQLIKRVDDVWTMVSQDAPSYVTADEFQPGADLVLPVDAELSEELLSAQSIAIDFPAFNDGRGLSLAVLIRRAGFTGELRAIGHTHEDILHYLIRCGVDAVELPDDRDVEIALGLLEPYSNYYQGSVVAPEPAFRRVQRG